MSRIWTPGERKIEVAGSIPTGPQIGPMPNGHQIQGVPQLGLAETDEFVGFVIQIGPVTIPFPMEPDDADRMADLIKAKAARVRERRCPTASPVTSPDASPAQADTASTIAPQEMPMGSGSIIAMPGSSSEGSSSASTHSANGASSEAC